MEIAVIGGGAIGAVIAAAARRAGHDVALCVRTPIDGFVLERDGQSETVDVRLVPDPLSLDSGPADIVWLTTKTTDNAGTAGWFGALCGPDTVVVSSQNGLDHHAHLAAYLPSVVDDVVPALAYIAAERLEPGRVRHLAGDRIVVPVEAEDLIRSAVSSGSSGGLTVRGAADMRTEAWRKLLGNLVANPITTLTMRRIPVMTEPGIEDLARGLLLEALQVGRAEGARLRDEDVARVIAGTAQYGEQTGSSMLYDRLAGRPLEHQFLTGEVVRRGSAHGIPTPLNSAVLALLEAIDRGRAAAT